MNDIRPIWSALAGVALILIGIAFLASPMVTSIAAGVTWGALLIVGGLVHTIHSLVVREEGWGWAFAGGLVAAAAGLMLLSDPVDAVVGLTLALAVYLVASGGMRIFGAAVLPLRGARGWMAFSGLASLVLGFVVASSWPVSGFVALGIILGVDTILAGCARLALAVGESRIFAPPPATPRIG